jgi:type IV pilus assembly protein PilM
VLGGRFASSIGVLGIDFGARGVKMLQVREHGGEIDVVGAARVELTQESVETDGAFADRLRAAFISGGFTGRKCIVSLARSDIRLHSVRLPKMSDEELRQAAVWEASQRFAIDREAMEVDFIRTGASPQGGENREEVLLIAAPHAQLYARLEPIMASGLRPIAVDCGFLAAARALSRQFRREADRAVVRAVFEIGATGSTVIILRGDQVAFCKNIPIGGEAFDKAVADHLQLDIASARDLRSARLSSSVPGTARISADEPTDRAVYDAVRPLLADLTKEVTLCLRYYGVTFRGKPPDRLIITGGEATEPRLDQMMKQACKVPIVFDDEQGTVLSLQKRIAAALNRQPGPLGAWTAAVGLSMRGQGLWKRSQKEEPVTGRRGAA